MKLAKEKVSHCKNGHEYSPENTEYGDFKNRGKMYRRCIACSKVRSKKINTTKQINRQLKRIINNESA